MSLFLSFILSRFIVINVVTRGTCNYVIRPVVRYISLRVAQFHLALLRRLLARALHLAMQQLGGNRNASNTSINMELAAVVAGSTKNIASIYKFKLRYQEFDDLSWSETKIRDIKNILPSARLCSTPAGVLVIGGYDRLNFPSRQVQIICFSDKCGINSKSTDAEIKIETKQKTYAGRTRISAAAWCDGGYIIVAGGDDPSVEVFSHSVGQWVKMSSGMPRFVRDHQLIAWGSSVYSIGGRDENAIRDVYRLTLPKAAHYTPDQRFAELLRCSWEKVSPLNRGKHSFAALAVKDRIIVVGGSDGTKCFGEVEIYDIHKNLWTTSPYKLCRAREKLSVLVIGIFCVVINGIDHAGRTVSEVEAIKLDDLFNVRTTSGKGFIIIGKRISANDGAAKICAKYDADCVDLRPVHPVRRMSDATWKILNKYNPLRRRTQSSLEYDSRVHSAPAKFSFPTTPKSGAMRVTRDHPSANEESGNDPVDWYFVSSDEANTPVGTKSR